MMVFMIAATWPDRIKRDPDYQLRILNVPAQDSAEFENVSLGLT
jgi:hypothetical protein